MIQMVSLGRGVCVLPEWLANYYCERLPLKKQRLGKNGIHKKLYLAMHHNDRQVSYINTFITVGKKVAHTLF